MNRTPNVFALGTMAMAASAWGCTGAAGDTALPGLPPEDTAGRLIEDTGEFAFETGLDTAPSDETPEHTLALSQTGTWVLGGDPGDPTSMTGELVVLELLDGEVEEPACEQAWALVGTREEIACDGCSYAFSVEHTLVSSTGECRAPELPETGDARVLGYDGDWIWWNYGDTGVWVPLYSTVEDTEGIAFSWEETVGVVVEDED